MSKTIRRVLKGEGKRPIVMIRKSKKNAQRAEIATLVKR